MDFDILPILKRVPIFSGLNESDLEIIANLTKEEIFPLNSYFFSQGDPGNKMYVILSGEVKVIRKNNRGEEEIARLRAGEFFGEMALLLNSPRTATCIATLETKVISLKREDFLQLVKSNKDLALRLKKEYLERIMENRHRDESLGKENLF